MVYDKTIKPYYIAEFNPKDTSLESQKRGQIQQQHLQYIQTLAQEKKLVLAGPYQGGGGLFFLNTQDEDQAKQWMEKDPTIQNELNGYTLKKWFTEKGLFTLDNDVHFQSSYGQLHPKAPEETMQYGQLVGDWDITVSNLSQEGSWTEDKAQWKFTYILDGHAIQDFWTKPSLQDETDQKVFKGTNIRIFNPATGQWKCTWVQNGNNDMNGVWTSYMNDNKEIILHDETGEWQIKFFNITRTSFDWKWDFKLEDGSMQTRVKIKAKRI
ncbi:MAG: hypothetical protein Tsb004_15390 [Allomuricauda sp.]